MIQRLFVEFLSNKGMAFQRPKENLLSFDYNEMHFLFAYFPKDQHYFRIMLPAIDTYSEAKAKILNEISKRYKVGKFIVVNNEIWISAESFVYSLSDIDKLFERLINLLLGMINDYRQETCN